MEDRLLNPQQEVFLAEYTNPKSENFGNAVQSALKAGYSENYANNITGLMPDWLFENIGDMKRLRKAEKNLTEVQEMDIVNEQGKYDPQLVEKRTKVDMFIAERLNKAKYSTRIENTGANGKELPTPIINVYRDNSLSEDSKA
jgi:phage terminase small subunit